MEQPEGVTYVLLEIDAIVVAEIKNLQAKYGKNESDTILIHK